MNTQAPMVHRYCRTDQDRLGEWSPVGSTWKTAASSGLVAHDIYHHLPTDTGTFSDEVVALGAEWYIDIQRPAVLFDAWPLSGFERNASDTLLNALDSKEPAPFELLRRQAPLLSEDEMDFFRRLARRLSATLLQSQDARMPYQEVFEARFVENLLWGYALARERFPDQGAVRKASRALAEELAALEKSEVPYGHEVTITLKGYNCAVSYSDADVDFVRENEVTPALLMTWCSCEPGYPAQHVTLHRDERSYVEYVSEHFAQQDLQDLADELRLIPEGESSELRPVYVREAATQELLRSGQAVKLPVSLMHLCDYTPRGVRVI
jgi:hypothetical protein